MREADEALAPPDGGRSPARSPRRERPVNSHHELNIALREAVAANRTLFGMRLESPVDVFLAIDKDDSGTIDMDELRAGIKRLGVVLSEEGMQGIMAAMDPDGTGQILYGKWAEETTREFERKKTKRHSSTVSHKIVSRKSIRQKRKTEKLKALQEAMREGGGGKK